ncbi:MAG: glutamate--tRNA ligase, partial [Betaproteobacteria bacterium]
ALVAGLFRERVSTLVEMAEAARYFYITPDAPAELVATHLTDATRPALMALHGQFADLCWTRDAIGTAIKANAAHHGLKPGQVMMALRVLVAGSAQTPAIDAVLALLGRVRARERLAAGLDLGH